MEKIGINPSMKKMMIQATGFGTGAGKSFLVALLCRILKEDGYKVAPFKALNLTGVTFLKDGREFGYSQVLQCQAAGIEPDWRTNPFTIKPKGNGLFDIILEGKCIKENYNPEKGFLFQVIKNIFTVDKEREKIKAKIKECFDNLSKEFDFIVIEGSGPVRIFGLGPFSSLLEIGNMETAKMANSSVILLSENVDSVPQTLSYLNQEERRLIKGVIINKCPADDFLEIGIKEKWINLGLKRLKKVYSKKIGLEILGILPYFEETNQLPDLDPIPSSERVPLEKWQKILPDLAQKTRRYLDLDRIYEIASINFR